MSPFMPTDTATIEENLHLNEAEREDTQRSASPRQQRRWLTVVQVMALIVALTLALYNNALIEQVDTTSTEAPALLVSSEGFEGVPPCNEGGVRLHTGLDLNANNILDATETQATTVLCNGLRGLSGPQGQPGTSGQDAFLQLLEHEVLPLGHETCPTGGTAMHSGLDVNGNGTLEEDEATSSVVVCNGSVGTNGFNGLDGMDGVNGTTGHSALVDKVPAPTYLCLDGFLVRFGVDDGQGTAVAGNGLLEDEEVHETLNFCFEPLRSERITDVFENAGNSMNEGCDAAVWSENHLGLLLAANDGTNGCELYRYSPLTNATTMVTDLHPNGDGMPGKDLGFLLVEQTNLVLFDATDGVNGRQLWVTDGSEAGTRVLGQIELAPPVPWFEGYLFFSPSANWLWTNGSDLRAWHEHPAWNASTQTAAQALLAPLSQPGQAWMVGTEHGLWFTASDATGDVEPYRLANDGSLQTWDVNPVGSIQLTDALADGEDLIAVAMRGTAKQLLHLSTNGSVNWLTAIAPSTGDTHLGEGMGLHRIGDNLVYDAVVSANEARLWTTNLANGITVQLSAELLAPGAQVGVANTGDRLLFDCITVSRGTEVCVTDATPLGTKVLHDLTPGVVSSDIRGLVAIEDGFAFMSDGVVEGTPVGVSLWVIEGEAMRLALNPWPGSSNSSGAVTYGNLVVGPSQLYFIANDGSSGHEWFRWSHGELSDDWIVIAR